jgi:putative CocE/NonD family hydrolase
MAARGAITVEYDVPVPLRDGTVLLADVYRPASGEPAPVVLTRTPYDKSATGGVASSLDMFRAAKSGYAVVVQDTRGRWASAGDFRAFVHEADDGYDTVEWCASQPWSTGKVGMFGGSYVGLTQWQAALTRPPHLTAIAPRITAADYHDGWTYQGGAFELGFCLSWTLGLAQNTLWRRKEAIPEFDQLWEQMVAALDAMRCRLEDLPLADFAPLKLENAAPYYFEWLAHPTYDEYWQRLDVAARHDQLTTPALNIGGWYDIFLGGTIANYVGMRAKAATDEARRGQKLVIGPWAHAPFVNPVGEVDFGARSSAVAVDLDGMHLRFYDRYLKGIQNGVDDEPPVKIFVMGENAWRNENEWPLARAQATPYYLHSGGKANSRRGDGMLSPEKPGSESRDHYFYNPNDPVPTRGGGLCCYGAVLPVGPYDQRSIEDRSDVLVYSTPPLARDVEVTGPILVTLYAASSAVDTDFTAKLVDVNPDGYARNLTDGIIRASFRAGTQQPPSPIEPDRVYEYTIDLSATSNLFKAGHQIRLEISSSNFPRFDRNPNTGRPFGKDAELRPALQTVLHDNERPSRVVLPIVPR